MVICNLNIYCIFFFPPKTDSILVIDTNTVLTFSLPTQFFESVPPYFLQVSHGGHRSQTSEFYLSFPVQLLGKGSKRFLRGPAIIYVLSSFIFEISNSHLKPYGKIYQLYRHLV